MPNRMIEALSKAPKLRLVEDPRAVVGGGAEARFDGWSNDVTGFGTSRDKTTYNQFSIARILSENELSALYHGDDLAARMVDVVPDEMLREGFQVELGDQGLNAEIDDQIEALGLVDKLADGIRWGRAFGGGGLLLGADDGRSAAAPLLPERAKALSYVYVFDRRYLWPLTYYREAGHPKLGQPETYMVTSPSSYTDTPAAVVHETRLVLFGGATTGIREREMNAGWDLSVLQRPNDVLANFNMGWNAVSVLLVDGNQAVFSMAGLAESISAGMTDTLTERLRAMDQARSVVRAIVVDAGEAGAEGAPPEKFERQHFPMTGIPETLDKMMLRLSAAVQIPVTILMGQSPAGLSATGESDLRWFYDRIRSEQTRKLAGKIRRIVRVMLRTKLVGREVEAIKVSFPPLWSEPPLGKAQTRKALLEGDAIAIDKGILLPEEVALTRHQPDGFDNEIQLSPEGVKAREDSLKVELDPPGDDGGDAKVEITPSDVAKVVTVNEARRAQGLGPLELEGGGDDPDGHLTVSAYAAKSEGSSGGGFGGAGFGGPPGTPSAEAKPAKSETETPPLKPEPEPIPE